MNFSFRTTPSILGALLLLTGIGCTSTDINKNTTTSVQLLFAGDLASNEGCADHSTTDACDLYTADLDLTTGVVSNVVQKTDTPESETYPAWNPNGNTAYFTVLKSRKEKDIGYVDITTGKTFPLISGGSWAEASPDGTTFLYVSQDENKIMTSTLENEGRTIKNPTPLTDTPNQQDPSFSFDNRYVLFHETNSGPAIGTVYDTQTQQITRYNSTSGHCAFGVEGLITVCDYAQGGGIFKSILTNGHLEESELYIADLNPNEIAEYDSEFMQCSGASFNYPTFCGDDKHILVSTSCNTGGSVSFSRLFLIDLSNDVPIYHPIGKSIDEAFGGPGKSTWTVDCL